MKDWHYSEKFERKADVYRTKMSEIEQKINELTNGEFFSIKYTDGSSSCFVAARGIGTYEVKELQALVDKHPNCLETVRECLKLHAEFYDFYLGPKWRKEDKKLVALLNAFPQKFSLKAYAVMKAANKKEAAPHTFSLGC